MDAPHRRLRTDGGDDDDDTPLEQLVAGVVIGLIFLVGFGLLALFDYPWFWVVFPVGFAGVLPAALALVKLYERNRAERASGRGDADIDVEGGARDAREDALAELRNQYARGNLDEDEFERRLERLLETETVADAERYAERGRDVEREQANE